MASTQLRASCALARSLRTSNRAFSTSMRRFEAAVPANTKPDTTELSEKTTPKEIAQSPNRATVWSRSQRPRSQAMSGPRFEQTDFSLQAWLAMDPQPLAAIELIHKEPVRWTHDRVVACDGGGGPTGHPRVFINTDKPEIAACGYCGLPFKLTSPLVLLLKTASSGEKPAANMSWFQKQFTLPAKSRGSYLVTDHVKSSLPEIQNYKVGILHLFVQHTSCALSLNENWDSDVRSDMSDALDRIAPDYGPKGEALYRHDAEGPDDMPAHIKSALIGASVTIPIKDGRLATGTWQGIWYLEFRASKHERRVVATIQGEKA
ncbi:hypothetical protein S40288_02218 [Stachybotrys chartarum IBT 40288]|nr:hypothetical protein S40288_02218 [Stachybotrys chartarum IBT 40288]